MAVLIGGSSLIATVDHSTTEPLVNIQRTSVSLSSEQVDDFESQLFLIVRRLTPPQEGSLVGMVIPALYSRDEIRYRLVLECPGRLPDGLSIGYYPCSLIKNTGGGLESIIG